MDLSLLAAKDDLQSALKLALSTGADFAEIYIENRTADTVRIEDRVVVEASRGILLGAGVRCLKNEKVGYAYIDGFNSKQLMEAARIASEIANNGRNPQVIGLAPLERTKPISSPSVFPVQIEAAKKIEIARSAEDGARSFDPRIKEALVTVIDYDKSILIANSEGRFISDRQVVVSLRVIAVAQQNGLRQRGFKAISGSIGYEIFDRDDPNLCGREAAEQAVNLLNADEAPAGKMIVVLGNGRGGVLLHEAIGHGFEGDFIRKKTSVFTDRVGEKIATSLCTIIDDGGIPGLRGTVNIDDEGTQPKRTVLVEHGILRGFIYDIMNARLLGVQPTGNGRRQSYRYIPTVRMTNTFMLPGDTPVDEIIASVKNGLYAKRIGGGQVDITSGNFVFEVLEGYLIENGKITRPVRGANLIGNGAEILTKIDMVGNDFEFDPGGGSCGKAGQLVPVGNGTPTLRISEMTVGGTRS
ncbi:MAG: TldD/PmbA family protein [bacterium]